MQCDHVSNTLTRRMSKTPHCMCMRGIYFCKVDDSSENFFSGSTLVVGCWLNWNEWSFANFFFRKGGNLVRWFYQVSYQQVLSDIGRIYLYQRIFISYILSKNRSKGYSPITFLSGICWGIWYPYFRDFKFLYPILYPFLVKIDNFGVLLPYKMHFFVKYKNILWISSTLICVK
jgi:hypothetical protein